MEEPQREGDPERREHIGAAKVSEEPCGYYEQAAKRVKRQDIFQPYPEEGYNGGNQVCKMQVEVKS
jgi:hypothetical protein